MSLYRRDFDKTKCMSLLIKKEKLINIMKFEKKIISIIEKEIPNENTK